MKKPSEDEVRRLKAELYDGIESGQIDIAEATKSMRNILGMSGREYAERIAKVSFKTLQAIEKRRGNPTLKTLEALGKPFGLKVGFVHAKKNK